MQNAPMQTVYLLNDYSNSRIIIEVYTLRTSIEIVFPDSLKIRS